jgi:hypothetical protein
VEAAADAAVAEEDIVDEVKILDPIVRSDQSQQLGNSVQR